MNKILILLILAGYGSFGQSMVWNETKTIGLVPAKGWSNTTEGENLSFILAAPFSPDPFKGSIDVSTASTLNLTLDELWAEYVIKGFPLSLKGYEKLDEGASRVDGVESRWIVFHTENHGMKFKGYTETFVKNNVLYIVTVTSLPSYYDEVEADFKGMIRSIKTLANGQ